MYTRVGNSIIKTNSSNFILPCEFLSVNPRTRMLEFTNIIPREYFDHADIEEVGESKVRINIYDRNGQRPASVSFETFEEAEETFNRLLQMVNEQQPHLPSTQNRESEFVEEIEEQWDEDQNREEEQLDNAGSDEEGEDKE